jgi:hypothetical protein
MKKYAKMATTTEVSHNHPIMMGIQKPKMIKTVIDEIVLEIRNTQHILVVRDENLLLVPLFLKGVESKVEGERVGMNLNNQIKAPWTRKVIKELAKPIQIISK